MTIFRRLLVTLFVFLPLVGSLHAQAPTLANSLDASGLSWTTGGARSWAAQTAISADGIDAARVTGLTAPDTEAWLRTTVNAPGILSWQWRLDLEDDASAVLELVVGDDQFPHAMVSSHTGWTAGSTIIHGSGSVPVLWRLRRVNSVEPSSTDAAYLDTVAYTAFGPPVLQNHADLTSRSFTARWTAVPNADSYVIEYSTDASFGTSFFGPTVDGIETSSAIPGLAPLTTYHYRLIANGPEGLTAISASRSVTTTAIVRPANDVFSAATALNGVSGSINATSLEATTEPEETVIHQGSVWFKWTAPSPGLWRFTAEPAANGVPPALHIYTGSTLADLVPVTSGSYHSTTETVSADFEVATGVTYRIALDAAEYNQGDTTLTWTRLEAYTPPANDAFSSPTVLDGNSGSVNATNIRATAEAGEPGAPAHSVWFSWRAPASGELTLDTSGSEIPTTLSVWTGGNLGSLTPLATVSAAPPASSRVSLLVTKDVVYRLSLDGQNGAQGALRLLWNLAIPTVPQSIVTPEIPDQPVDAAPLLIEALATSGLPVSYHLVSGPGALDDALLTFTGQPGTIVIRVTQPGDATYLPASADFNVVVRPPPANDRINGALRLANNTGAIDFDLGFATADTLDVYPSRRSVWYRWNSNSRGILTLDTESSPAPVTLVVYSGTVQSLSEIASDVRPGVRPALSVEVNAGVDYFILVDSLAEAPGAARLAWSFAAASLAQTIDFPAPPDVGASVGSVRLEATASSGLPVEFTLVSGPATLDGSELKLTGSAGRVTVRASQPGDHRYLAAPSVLVSFEVLGPPENDRIAAAIRLSGASGSVTGTNVDATSDPLDPAPAARSVWWRWTAPSSGLWTVDTAGSEVPMTLTVLTGANPEALTVLATDLRAAAHGRVTIPVYSGTPYWIVVDTLSLATGAIKLTWDLAGPTLEQTIAFDQELPDLVAGDPVPLLTPTASSGLPVSVVVVSGPATLVDGVLKLTGKAGVVTLRATQEGDPYYKPAPAVTRTFSVTAAPKLKITISNLRHVYDGWPKEVTVTTDAPPRLGDIVVTYNGSTMPPTDAGTYSVVASADNSKASAKLVIDKAPLRVIADNKRKLAGEPNPPLTFTYEGFVIGDDESKLARAPVASTPGKPASAGGTYPIKLSGGASTNYKFTYVPGTLQVDTFAGRYETLLTDFSGLPCGRLEFTVAASGKTFTGKLQLARELATIPFKSELVLDSVMDVATANFSVTHANGSYAVSLAALLDGRFDATLLLQGNQTGSPVEQIGASSNGWRVFVPAAKEKLTWTGAHTAVLFPPNTVEPFTVDPRGAGYATASIDAKGNLKFSGRLADDTAFTAKLAPAPDGSYRLFATPYSKRRDSYLAGDFALVSHPDASRFPGRRHLPASAGTQLVWAKAPGASDKTYAAGFGPLLTPLAIEPWVKPKAPVTVALAFEPGDLNLGASRPVLPLLGSFAASGKFTILDPVTTPANPTRFSLKLTPGTGVLSGSFVLSDQTNPPPAKPESRKVNVRGVLLLPPEANPPPETPLGSAYLIVPRLSTDAHMGNVSGELRFETP